MSGEAGSGSGGALPATIDNFDTAMANVDMSAPAEGEAPASDDGQQALGSMFENFATPAKNVDPATGRELDGPPGVPDGSAEDDSDDLQAAPEDEGDELDDVLGEEGEEGEEDANPDSELLSRLKLDEVVPEDLMGRLLVKQKINGEEREVPLNEATENGMRLVDYSRSKRELAQQRSEHQAAVDNLVGLTQRWKGDASDARSDTRRDLERLGVPLQAIARDIAEEYVALQNMTPTERANWERAQKAEQDAWAAREELRRVRSQAEGKEREHKQGTMRERVEGWRDKAFKASSLQNTATMRSMFAAHLNSLWDRSSEVSEADVQSAVKATQEEWRESVEAHQADTQKAGNGKRKPLKPRPTTSQGGQRAPRKGVKPTLDNFDDFIAGR